MYTSVGLQSSLQKTVLQVYRELLEAVEVTKEALRELQFSAVPIISPADKAQVEKDVRNEVSVSPCGPGEMPEQVKRCS